ncbi:hypothetical protein IGI04_006764 [Brassica rapa subsp. trilocularis]|uniref:DUF4283 domain-containing protein n=1 Tax=Brassica rapa subsp. trilocularis TaxID=1813537 RepID=A0ABQ7NHV8_BRACM|nr:hypothetical protein IGI04_006764 [Brassica rapa subsp. trilocularis]
MSSTENPWLSPERASALIPPQASAETAPLVDGSGKILTSLSSSTSQSPLQKTGSEKIKFSDITIQDIFEGFTVLPPKKSHLHSSTFPGPVNPPTLAAKAAHKPSSSPASSRKIPPKNPSKTIPLPPLNRKTSVQNPPPQNPPPIAKPWVDKARQLADRTLKRLAPVSYSTTCVPQVTIPDEVFIRGAEMHREFILGSFLAKMPSYQSIQSVLNFMWGKGHKLDIRTNLKERTIMVRIPNEYIRTKVLEKKIWYVGTTMFHVSPWSAMGSINTLDLASIPLWAHLKGLPLDLRSLEGLSFAAGLIGEPKETDEFTKNLTDVNIAHVKIEANVTTPLPALIELRRTSGEIFPVEVHYPWAPPTCSFCHQIGHILKDCLTAPPEILSKTPPLAKIPQKTPTPTDIPPAAKTPSLKPPVVPTPTHPPDPVTEFQHIEDENIQKEFESDLQEIMSPPPKDTMDEDHALPTLPTINTSSSHNPITLPLKTLTIPSFSPPSPVTDCITFTNLPLEAPFIVGLQALPQLNRRITPFKHKPSFKKQLPQQKLSLKNSFAVLDQSDPPSPASDPHTPPSNYPDSYVASPPTSPNNHDPSFVSLPTLSFELTKEPLPSDGVVSQSSL